MGGPTTDAIIRRTCLSRALKALRRRRGVGVAELADAIGMPVRSYQHFESGRGRINVDRVHEIARVLHADAPAIFAAAELGSPDFAVRASDNKLMSVILLSLKDFDRLAGDNILHLDARTLMTAFDRTFKELAALAKDRADAAAPWSGPDDPEDQR